MSASTEKDSLYRNMHPVPTSALPNYVKSHKTRELMNIMNEIRLKLDALSDNRISKKNIRTQNEYLTRLASRRKQILSELRQMIGSLQVIWVEQTAGYKGSDVKVKKAADKLIQRLNVVIGTVDVSKQSSVNYAYRYVNQLLPRMQSAIIITSGDHLFKTEELNYELEKIKVYGISGMAAKAGLMPQNTGVRSRIMSRLRRKKSD